jgi:hypothetical protein
VKSADPYYWFWHERQEASLNSLNLEKSRQKDIEDMAKMITCNLIESFDDSQFHVASQTKLGHFYSINLALPKCNCPDFLCIQFCKHIGAVYFHFPHLRPADVPAPSPSGVPNEPQRAPNLATSANKFHLLVQVCKMSTPYQISSYLSGPINWHLHLLCLKPSIAPRPVSWQQWPQCKVPAPCLIGS